MSGILTFDGEDLVDVTLASHQSSQIIRVHLVHRLAVNHRGTNDVVSIVLLLLLWDLLSRLLLLIRIRWLVRLLLLECLLILLSSIHVRLIVIVKDAPLDAVLQP